MPGSANLYHERYVKMLDRMSKSEREEFLKDEENQRRLEEDSDYDDDDDSDYGNW